MKNIIVIVTVIVTVTAIGLIYWFYFRTSATTEHNPTSTLTIKNKQINVEVVDTLQRQLDGLSGRDPLSEDSGMLFIFSIPHTQVFWMKDMKFPLDIIWIGGGQVLGFVENAPIPDLGKLPKIFTSPSAVDKVLEVNAGSVKKWHIKKGDKVEFETKK